MSGEHDGHSHAISENADRRWLAATLALIVAFMVLEVVIGLVAHSLALLSDAAHMLTDAGAIGLSLIAMSLAARPAAGGLTFGLKRAGILSALLNGVALFGLSLLIVYEAIRRLLDPLAVEARLMLLVALVGVLVNLAAVILMARADRTSLNIRGSYQHILTDLYAFIGTSVAAIVILLTGFQRADPLASLLVAALMLRASFGLLRDAGRVLLEAAPAGLSPQAVAAAIAGHPSVANVHELHIWEITSGFPALSAHVLVRPGDDCHAVRRDLEDTLKQQFAIEHTTMQVDHREETQLVQVQQLAAATTGGLPPGPESAGPRRRRTRRSNPSPDN